MTLLAALLRCVPGAGFGLWGDEFGTLRFIEQPAGVILSSYSEQLTMHLYLLGMKAWVWVAGDSPLALKLPSMLAGVGLVPLVYGLGARWVSWPAGAVAAVLVAVDLSLIYYSRFARVYSVLVVVVVVGMALYASATRSPRSRTLVLLSVCNAVGLALSMLYIGFVAAQIVHASLSAACSGRAGRKRILGLAASLVATGALALAFYSQALNEFLAFRRWYSGSAWFRVDWIGVTLHHYFPAGFWLVLPLVAVGTVVVWKRDRLIGGLLLSWTLIPWLFFVVTGPRHSAVAFARFLLPTLPASFILIGAGVVALARLLPLVRSSGRAAAFGCVFAVFLSVVPGSYVRRLLRDPSPPYAAALAHIAERAAPDDLAASFLGMDRPDLLELPEGLPTLVPLEQLAAAWPPPATGRIYILTKLKAQAEARWSSEFSAVVFSGDGKRQFAVLQGAPGTAGGPELRRALRHFLVGVVAGESKAEAGARRYYELTSSYQTLSAIALADGDEALSADYRARAAGAAGRLRDLTRTKRSSH